MPIQTWTPGQQLTAAQLTAVTNMLPAPQVATANVASAVPGTMYRCQPAGGGNITITLPAPTLGNVVGMSLDAATGTATLQHNATELIYGVDTWTSGTRGAASLTIAQPDVYVVVIADGTNWREYGSLANAPWKFFDSTLGIATASVTIPASGSLPAGWSAIELDLFLRSTTAGTADNVVVQFNGNTTGTAYSNINIIGSGSAASSNSSSGTNTGGVGVMPGNTATANVFSSSRTVIPNYGASGPLSYVTFYGAMSGANSVGTNAGIWTNSGPLTTILLSPSSGANFAAGSRFVLRLLP